LEKKKKKKTERKKLDFNKNFDKAKDQDFDKASIRLAKDRAKD